MIDGVSLNLEILDCTIRDGGYVNNWNFEKKLVREVYRSLSKAGLTYVELGFIGTEKYFSKEKYGIWRFSEAKDVRDVTSGIHGSKIALMVDFGKIDIAEIAPREEGFVSLIRIAVHKTDVQNAIRLAEAIKKKGYDVALNLMGYSNYTIEERKDLCNNLKKIDHLDYIYFADSYGSIFPEHMREYLLNLLEIKESVPGLRIGFHPHNNLQMAFANTCEAIRCGVDIVDSSIYGMGRGAGNLPTEIILLYLENTNNQNYNAVPVLNIIDRYFVRLKEENPWGYQLSYMLTGMFQCHPNYAKALVDMKEYTIEDIWKATDFIRRKNPVGFSKKLLDEIIQTGIIGNSLSNKEKLLSSEEKGSGKAVVKHEVPYIGRHENKDFLILANGPSLKEYKQEIDTFISKYSPIVMGANYMGGLFKPHYHVFNNKRRFMEYADTVEPESKLLIGQYIEDKLIREYSNRQYERIYYEDKLNAKFDIIDGVIQTNCRTIAILLLGMAIVMGAKRVFAVGMDGYMGFDSISGLHFYNEKDEKENRALLVEMHHWCQIFLVQIDEFLNKQGKEGIHILTPTSYKSFFKGIGNYI